MLDVVYAWLLEWGTGGKSKYKPRMFKDWMPSDWATEEVPKRKPNRNDLIKQLDAFVKATRK